MKQSKKIIVTVLSIIPFVVYLNTLLVAGFPQTYPGNITGLTPAGVVNQAGLSLLVFVAIAALLTYGLIISKKEFRYFLSRTCLICALDKKDILKQMYYLGSSLQEYNKYLRRHLKHQIKDIDGVFSRVSILYNETKTKLIRSFFDSFETGVESDKLKPMKYIWSTPELIGSEDIGRFLIAISLKSQLKVVGAFLAASVPIVISIIALYTTHKLSP